MSAHSQPQERSRAVMGRAEGRAPPAYNFEGRWWARASRTCGESAQRQWQWIMGWATVVPVAVGASVPFAFRVAAVRRMRDGDTVASLLLATSRKPQETEVIMQMCARASAPAQVSHHLRSLLARRRGRLRGGRRSACFLLHPAGRRSKNILGGSTRIRVDLRLC
jgi:hypothetical protein